jgi:Protein of unknown function (DUF3710)
VVFRRRRQQDTDDVLAEAYDTEAETEQEPVGATTDATSMPSQGPWDEADLDDPSAGRVDLGGLLIPAVQGMELRAEIADDRVIAATVVLADSAVQLQPFAAPRHQGIWDEVRGELAATVTKQGGTVDESIGPFGPELKARVSVNPQAGKTGSQLARFLGIDGPRWFLRAVITGRAAADAAHGRRVEDLLRGVVVVRGSSPMAPRDPIPLRLPEDGTAEPDNADAPVDGGQERPPLDPFRRGPEITEVR